MVIVQQTGEEDQREELEECGAQTITHYYFDSDSPPQQQKQE